MKDPHRSGIFRCSEDSRDRRACVTHRTGFYTDACTCMTKLYGQNGGVCVVHSIDLAEAVLSFQIAQKDMMLLHVDPEGISLLSFFVLPGMGLCWGKDIVPPPSDLNYSRWRTFESSKT